MHLKLCSSKAKVDVVTSGRASLYRSFAGCG